MSRSPIPRGSTRPRGFSKRSSAARCSAAPKARSSAIMAGTAEGGERGARARYRGRHRARRFLDGLAQPRRGLLRADRRSADSSERQEETQHERHRASRRPRSKRSARPPAPSAFSNALVFGWRAVLKFKHVPEQLFDLVMTPIMFTLLFTFVFGGALAGSTGEYLQFFLPGILVQTVVLQRGLFRHGPVDRSRQGPVRPLPLAADLVARALRRADGRRRPAPPDRRRRSS